MRSNTHYHLRVSKFELTDPGVGKFIVERLLEPYTSLEVARETRRQLSAQQDIAIDHIDIRRCKSDCV